MDCMHTKQRKKNRSQNYLLDPKVERFELLALVELCNMCARSLVQHGQSARDGLTDDFTAME